MSPSEIPFYEMRWADIVGLFAVAFAAGALTMAWIVKWAVSSK